VGWGRMLLLGDWGQQMDIEEQREELASLRRQLRTTSGQPETTALAARVDRMEAGLDELRLYVAALVRYLGRQSILQQDDFRALVEAIDAEDGQTDGGYRGEVME
jgi:hypothetical protein